MVDVPLWYAVATYAFGVALGFGWGSSRALCTRRTGCVLQLPRPAAK